MPNVSFHEKEGVEPREFVVEEGDILWESLSDQGEMLPHGCLSGSCGSCRIDVISGAENLAPADGVESDTLEHLKSMIEGEAPKCLRLSCRAEVRGNVTFTLPNF